MSFLKIVERKIEEEVKRKLSDQKEIKKYVTAMTKQYKENHSSITPFEQVGSAVEQLNGENRKWTPKEFVIQGSLMKEVHRNEKIVTFSCMDVDGKDTIRVMFNSEESLPDKFREIYALGSASKSNYEDGITLFAKEWYYVKEDEGGRKELFSNTIIPTKY